MDYKDFSKIMAFISAAIDRDIKRATLDAYFSMLNDLPADLVMAAARKVIASDEYPTLPTVGKLRKAAQELCHIGKLSAPEAWGEALKAVRNHGYYGEAEAMKELPPDVAQVVRWMGWREICLSDAPDVVRAQFMRMYEVQEKRTRELAGLPPGVRDLVKGLGDAFALPTLPNSCEHKKKEVV